MKITEKELQEYIDDKKLMKKYNKILDKMGKENIEICVCHYKNKKTYLLQTIWGEELHTFNDKEEIEKEFKKF